jgi:threonylcarbamoyladenosine tRNA methylthiotransferase MtaB
MKYAVVTFGCRVNQADSLQIEDALRVCGGVSSPVEDAELVIVNTCSVTASADQAARQTIRRVARVNTGAKVVVTGCYATRRPEEAASLPNVVRVVGNTDKDSLVEMIADGVGLTTAARDGDGPCGSTLAPGVAGRTALTLRVQTGCEERCSYCIIPSTRGASRSRPLATILEQVDSAITAGYKEIALTGVHLGSYGRDLDGPASLSQLLTALSRIDAPVLFRISSLEPMDCTDAIVDLVASSPRFAPHFHLPLQHGSDATLRMMRRPYTNRYYRRLVERVVSLIPHASIGSDIIVGFPGETAADFGEMQRVLATLPLTYLHVFPYSDRPGTAAAALQPKLDGKVVRARAAQIRDIATALAQRFRQSQVGRTLRALTVDDGQSVVTGNYLKLRLDATLPRNEWVDVRVTSERDATVLGVAA